MGWRVRLLLFGFQVLQQCRTVRAFSVPLWVGVLEIVRVTQVTEESVASGRHITADADDLWYSHIFLQDLNLVAMALL